MTYLVERLAELKRYLTHARTLRPRVPDTERFVEVVAEIEGSPKT